MPNDRQLKITVETIREYHERVALTLDGQTSFCLEYEDEVKIRKSSRYFYLARMTGENYYKALRAKLGWGE
jgi:NAD kinase